MIAYALTLKRCRPDFFPIHIEPHMEQPIVLILTIFQNIFSLCPHSIRDRIFSFI